MTINLNTAVAANAHTWCIAKHRRRHAAEIPSALDTLEPARRERDQGPRETSSGEEAWGEGVMTDKIASSNRGAFAADLLLHAIHQ
jgi:hypothetical protein